MTKLFLCKSVENKILTIYSFSQTFSIDLDYDLFTYKLNMLPQIGESLDQGVFPYYVPRLNFKGG